MSTYVILDELSDRCRDDDWLNTNADTLYSQIDRDLRHRDTLERGVSALIVLVPWLVRREDLLRWGKLLRQALRASPEVHVDEQESERFWVQQDNGVLLMIRHHYARPLPWRRRRRERMEPSEILEIYMLLLIGHGYLEKLTPDAVRDILRLTRAVNDPYLYAKFYQLLAFTYNRWRQFNQALDCAWVALDYFNRHDDPLEIGLTAFALAATHHASEDWEESIRWLQVARHHLDRTTHSLQKGLVTLELTSQLLCIQDNATAEKYARESVGLFQGQDLSTHLALAYYYLALAHIYQRSYNESREYLDRALALYQTTGNEEKAITVGYTLAYVEASAGYKSRALQYLYNNLEALNTLAPGKWHDAQRSRIERLIEAIQTDNDIATIGA